MVKKVLMDWITQMNDDGDQPWYSSRFIQVIDEGISMMMPHK